MIEHPKLCKRARARCLKYNLYVDIATKFNPITMKFVEEKKNPCNFTYDNFRQIRIKT